MKTNLLFLISVVALIFFPKENFSQAPNLGTASSFALFTAAGAFNNIGASTYITGDVGTNVGAFNAFPPGTLVGEIHVADPISAQAATDVAVAYSSLSAVTCGIVHGVLLGGGEILTPNVYCLGAASTLDGTLTLDGQGDPNSLFIFKINGALSTSTFSNVVLTNSASLCNVYWQINGQFDLGNSSVFMGTVISNGALNLLDGSSILGRGLSIAGAISLQSNIVTIALPPTASAISAGGATTFCVGGNVILSGNVGGTWSTGATTPSITVTLSGDYYVTNADACGSATSNHIIVTANPLPAATAGSNAAICIGSSVTIGSASIAGHTYLWTPSAGLSSATISNPVASPTVTTTYTLTEIITATGCQASNSVTVTVIPDPGITGQPVSQTACIGTSASFTVTATGSGLTYQWRKGVINLTDGGNISGATSATLTINPVNYTNAVSDYNVVVTSTGTCSISVTSILVSLVVNFEPVINTQPVTQTVCEGNSVSFSVAATGTVLTYQWRKGTVNLVNGGNISGATSITLTINPSNISDASENYNVFITGICLPVVTSDNVALVVNSATAITTQPTTQTACTGSSVSFSVVATGAGLTYQWRKGTVNLVNGGNISGATSATLSINPVDIANAASNYNVVISGLCSANVTSANAALIVNTFPVISTAPANQVVCEGNSVSFTVVATGTTLIYQWRKGTVNLVNGGNISGATSATLTIYPASMSDEASDYNVIITGTCSPAVTSINVSLEVTAAPGVSISSCVGGSVSFSATANGPGLSYQWRKGTVDLVNGGNISGATSVTLTINPVNLEDASPDYNVVITGVCSPFAISRSISLVVNTPAVIVTQPVNQIACEGTSVSFSVAATGSNLTYQWRKGSVNLVNGGNISGVTTSVLIINPMLASDVASNYNVVITGACSSLITSTDASLMLCEYTAIYPGEVITDAAFTVYPNPFRTSVTITVNKSLLSKKPEFRMYNALGVQVMSSNLNKNISTLETRNLVVGIYMYKVIVDGETIYTGKLISQQ